MSSYESAFASARTADERRITAWVERILAALEDHDRPAGACRLLDIGCGVGRFCEPLSMRFASTIGIDASASMLALARARCSGEILWVRGDAAMLPIRSASIDVILSSMVFEHVTDKPGFLCELSRTLAPDGRVILRTMLPADIDETTWYDFSPEARVIESARTWPLDALAAEAGRAGLTLRFVEQVVERVGHDIEIGTLSGRLAARAYEALRRVSPASLERGIAEAIAKEHDGSLHERLASSLLVLRHRAAEVA